MVSPCATGIETGMKPAVESLMALKRVVCVVVEAEKFGGGPPGKDTTWMF